MLTRPNALKALSAFFKKAVIAQLPELYKLLDTTSRMSVFRRLRDLDYLSSYSHLGCYYTLSYVAHFDSQGLWFYGGVGFSRFGSLKKTVIQLIEQSTAGRTHEELEKQLHLRVHNTLLELVRCDKITREKFKGVFLYLSIHSDTAQKQRVERLEGSQKRLPDGIVVEVLAEIIRGNQSYIDQKALLSRLAAKDIVLTSSQLKQLCMHLDLKKTVGFPS